LEVQYLKMLEYYVFVEIKDSGFKSLPQLDRYLSSLPGIKIIWSSEYYQYHQASYLVFRDFGGCKKALLLLKDLSVVTFVEEVET
jgi:hypothetical protein